ncbi:hypothetical protein DFJ74DRAFT_709081 [Hyaloraphidium curvatum]|nr:hypothetical protein DFJ74DRAFT_709081 [Hyaloraphidium curvatum]
MRHVAAGLAAAAGALYLAALYGAHRFQRETAELVERLLSDSAEAGDSGHNDTEKDLPPAVAEYLAKAVPASSTSAPSYARIWQRGLIALAPSWASFETCKVVALLPGLRRGYVWTCVLTMGGFIKICIRDSLVNGKGESTGSIFGLFSLGRTYATPEVTRSSLLRYLGEGVWSPQVYLPSNGAAWEPSGEIEGKPAYKVSIRDPTCSTAAEALLTFHAETGMPEHLLMRDRPRLEGKAMVPRDMGALCWEPRDFGGVAIPARQEAWWVVDGRKEVMWKAEIFGIDWDFRSGGGK